MKALVVGALPIVLGLVLLPALLGGGDVPPTSGCGLRDGEVGTILATIRALESGGDYTAQASGSSASGAYQFIDSSWDGYGGYARAGDAPPDVQDEKAADLVQRTLERYDGDVAAVPIVWYIGHVPPVGSSTWDLVPAPSAGNVLTPRRYQARWLNEYQHRLEGGTGDEPSEPTPGECIGGAVPALPGGWSLPGPKHLIDANPQALTEPHHSYPAWDWIIPINTPIYAVRGGTVVSTHYWRHNWWERGCQEGSIDACETCGIGVTILSDDGTRWTYCHGSELTTALHTTVLAGQQIMWSGNTGRSGTPHLHLEIRVNGERIDPRPILAMVADFARDTDSSEQTGG